MLITGAGFRASKDFVLHRLTGKELTSRCVRPRQVHHLTQFATRHVLDRDLSGDEKEGIP